LDRDGNGAVDDGSELFGDATPNNDGTIARNGFEALAALDGETGPADGQIDARDMIYDRLRLWFDLNHNGYSEPTEIVTLPEAGVERISTSYVERRRQDNHGNWYRYEGWVELTAENGNDRIRRVFDVYLRLIG
jgi:hypothetical protein